MVGKRYLKTLHELLDRIGDTQTENIEKAGEMMAKCWANGGAVFITEMGHGTAAELSNRAGGLFAIHQFSYQIGVNSQVATCQLNRPTPEPIIPELEHVRTGLKLSNIRAGDVVFVGSVSGRNLYPIETAIQCQAMGVKVIALTAFDYTANVTTTHPSGKKLKDVGDLAIDIGAPFGDASQEIEGLPVKALPISGIGFVSIMWMICGEAIEKMLARGLMPHVFLSHNREGGPEFNTKSGEEYNKVGY